VKIESSVECFVQDSFCRAAVIVVRCFFRAFCEIRMHKFGSGLPEGGFILASNHVSHFDPPIIGSHVRPYINWMAMEELFQNRASAAVMQCLRAFPVKREQNDLLAVRVAIKRLTDGRVVGVFPEGGIRAGKESVLEGALFWPGVAALSAITGRPIVPCVIFGADRLYRPRGWSVFRRVPVWIGLGQTIYPNSVEPAANQRADLQQKLGSAFVQLGQQMQSFYRLAPDDLPTSPQARKRPDYQPKTRKRPCAERAAPSKVKRPQ
jgi:1-acyl-sn-glycerol-3-phosphate acyltransferase